MEDVLEKNAPPDLCDVKFYFDLKGKLSLRCSISISHFMAQNERRSVKSVKLWIFMDRLSLHIALTYAENSRNLKEKLI